LLESKEAVMSKQQMPYVVTQAEPQQAARLLFSEPVNLGKHTLEVLENQTVMLVNNAQWDTMVQLDRDEAYRLLVTLQILFGNAMQSKDHEH
jgi:hypothetical protein